MNNFKKYALPVLTLAVIAFFVYLFTQIVVYMAISIVLALLGAPLMKLMARIKINKKSVPNGITAFITLMAIYGVFFLLFYQFIPLFVKEVKFLMTLNFGDIFHDLLIQFPKLKEMVLGFGTEEFVRDSIINQGKGLMNYKEVSKFANGAASVAGSLAGGLLSVSFITFFLLKEETMVYSSILLITPSQYEAEVKDILRTTRVMLTKYFAGLFLDVFIVSIIVSAAMYFCGIKNAIFIGVFAGIMNVIPYVGPVITLVFAMLLGVTGCFEYNTVNEVGSVVTKIFFILLGVNLIDGILIQPYIFSNSVKAHPLEIFLVILMAATLGGIIGMIIAIPTYTLIRIVAKEFLTNLKFFKKITDSIPE
ncbi:MAG: AI-2E family transporter [Bacteroidia bacterium]|nr:AI-2E family transporter [Bacteroidia bacterium]